MTNKNKHFKIIFSTVITFVFLVIAYGSGESSSEESALNKTSAENIITVLCKNEIIDKKDVGEGIGEIEISLKMNEDKTFKYALRESYANDTGSSINATGTYELIGNVQQVNTPGWTDKYGEDSGKYQYEQVIKFKGTTNDGKNLDLTAKLCQFGNKNELESRWFLSNEDYSSNNQESVSVDNFTLPTEFIYP